MIKKKLRVILWLLSALLAGYLVSFLPKNFEFGATVALGILVFDFTTTVVIFKDKDILQVLWKSAVWVMFALVTLLIVM